MQTRKFGLWEHGAAVILLAGLIALASGACRTIETECNCGRDCGECITYQDRLALQEEAKKNLAAIYIAEVSYFSNANTYSPNFNLIAWYPGADHRYAYFLPEEVIQTGITEPYQLPAGVTVSVSQYGFTAAAVVNIDCDETLDVWTINDARIIKNLVNDVIE